MKYLIATKDKGLVPANNIIKAPADTTLGIRRYQYGNSMTTSLQGLKKKSVMFFSIPGLPTECVILEFGEHATSALRVTIRANTPINEELTRYIATIESESEASESEFAPVIEEFKKA